MQFQFTQASAAAGTAGTGTAGTGTRAQQPRCRSREAGDPQVSVLLPGREPGSGLGDDKTKETLVFQECVCGVKGIYLTMKHGNKCAYIEQCEYVSYRYSTSKGRASPKPKKKSKYEFVFFEECKM